MDQANVSGLSAADLLRLASEDVDRASSVGAISPRTASVTLPPPPPVANTPHGAM